VFCFQDTNPLQFRALVAALGVAARKRLDFTSLTVPRQPGEQVGEICTLEQNGKPPVTVNVEYNMLATLKPDVAGPDGFSPYPGNINALLIRVSALADALDRSAGIVPEFVNPKYADESRTRFKSPARLECMMQDLPRVLAPGSAVGFVRLPRVMCKSSLKNNVKEARSRAAKSLPPECALSQDIDTCRCAKQIFEMAGGIVGAKVRIDCADDPIAFLDIGIAAAPPLLALLPSWATSVREAAQRCAGLRSFTMSARSALVLEGDVRLEGTIELDGALVARALPGETLTIRDATVQNASWDRVASTDAENPSTAIRGYVIRRKETDERVTQ
jgi:UDP-sugar pyrophosphorylase